MKRIYLVRHCKAIGQEPEAVLTIEGKKQAELLSDFFSSKDVDYVVSSPFERAKSTIYPFSKMKNIEIHIDNRLCERVLSLENIPNWMERLEETFENLDLKLPGGESTREAMSRGIDIINELFNRTESNIVAVTHGNLMSIIMKYFNEEIGFSDWKNLSNPDIYEFIKTDETGEIQVKRIWKQF